MEKLGTNSCFKNFEIKFELSPFQQKNTKLLDSDGSTKECKSIDELCSSQEEAYTRLILHWLPACCRSLAIIWHHCTFPRHRCLVLLLYCGMGLLKKECILIQVLEINADYLTFTSLSRGMEKKLCTALSGFHAFTECNTASAFVRKCKIKYHFIKQV